MHDGRGGGAAGGHADAGSLRDGVHGVCRLVRCGVHSKVCQLHWYVYLLPGVVEKNEMLCAQLCMRRVRGRVCANRPGELSISSLPGRDIVRDEYVASSCPPSNAGLFGKDPQTGRLPLSRRIIFFPYLWMVRQWALKKREFRKEDRFNVIVEGPKGRTEAAPSSVSGSVPLGGPRRVYLGCWPEGGLKHLPIESSTAATATAGASLAVIDVTCELQRTHKGLEYLCLPTWDTRGPDTGALAKGVKWAVGTMEGGNDLYVHCAHGHGRSAAFVAALIVYLGMVPDVQSAVAHLKRRRPRVKMNAEQTQAAEQCLLLLRAGR